MEPFLGQIAIVGFNFAPRGWALCNGQILPINKNQSLYSLLGTMYGGDGRTTFALPDLRGRTPMHPDGAIREGTRGGREDITLTWAEIPSHNHLVNANNVLDFANQSNNPENRFYGHTNAGDLEYHEYAAGSNVNMRPTNNTGSNQAFNNLQPLTVLNYIIATEGLFPSRN